MKRLFVGVVLFIIVLFAGYSFFWQSPQPTALVVSDAPVKVSVEQTDIVVKEERIEKKLEAPEVVADSDFARNSVWLYSTKYGQVIDKIRVGSSPVAVQISPNGWWVYVLNGGSNTISVIDVESLAIVKTIPLPEEPRTMRLNKKGDLLAVVTYTNKVLLFETKEFNLVATLSTSKKPADVIFSLEGKYLFVVAERSNLLEKINPYLGHAIGSAKVGERPVALDVTSKDRAFVVNSGENSVSVIDVIDMSKAKKYDVLVGSEPVDVFIDPKEELAYVANKDGDSVSVFQVETYNPIAEIPAGDGPIALAYNVFSEPNGVVYVINELSNDISVIDVVRHEEIKRWKAGSRPSDAVVSPDGKILFVTMKG